MTLIPFDRLLQKCPFCGGPVLDEGVVDIPLGRPLTYASCQDVEQCGATLDRIAVTAGDGVNVCAFWNRGRDAGVPELFVVKN